MPRYRLMGMDVNCEGCAGCCIDWRALAPPGVDPEHERRGRFRPLDDVYNLTPLASDEVRAFLDEGWGEALTPRVFAAASGATVNVGGVDLAAIDGRPAFVVGLQKVPKPVAPFGSDSAWLPSCVFLDPGSLQCRIHGDDHYPEACATYPGDNLALGAETECERVERGFGGERLHADDPGDARPLFGPGALGGIVFAHPEPDRITAAVERIAAGAPTPEDRAEFTAVAAACCPGSLAVDRDRYRKARKRALAADSWIGRAAEAWRERAGDTPDPSLGQVVEERRGAPETPGWE